MDLGSGDGRTVITAAKRGARALGIEYNPDMVELSKRNAAEGRRRRQGELRQGRPVRDRLLEGDRDHHVPAAGHQPASCARRSSTSSPARASSRTPSTWTTGSPTRPPRPPTGVHALVPRAAVDRPGARRRHLEELARRPQTHADVSEDLRERSARRLSSASWWAARSRSRLEARPTAVRSAVQA